MKEFEKGQSVKPVVKRILLVTTTCAAISYLSANYGWAQTLTNSVALSTLGQAEGVAYPILSSSYWQPDPYLPMGMTFFNRSFLYQAFNTGTNASSLQAITVLFSSDSYTPISNRSITVRNANGSKIASLVLHESQGSYGTKLKPHTPVILAENTTYLIGAEVGPSPSGSFGLVTTSGQATFARPSWTIGPMTVFSYWNSAIAYAIDGPYGLMNPTNGTAVSTRLVFALESTPLFPDILVEQPAGTEIPSNSEASSYGAVTIDSGELLRTYVVKNIGQSNLRISSIEKSGPHASDFQINPASADIISPGDSFNLTVSFTPKGAGARTAVLQITSNDPDENPFVINLAGEGLSPGDIAVFDQLNNEISNNSPAILFPDTLACLCEDSVSSTNSSSSKTYTIKNTGEVDLNIISISNEGANASDFELTGAVSTNLAPNMTGQITVTFQPETGGTKETALRISSNDPDENPFILNFRGFGIGTNLDSDGDGLNDAAEYCMSPLGFDWKIKQTNLVQNLYLNAPLAGLYLSNTIVANPSLLNLVSSAEYAASRALGRSDVTGNPTAYGLYTSNSIMDLRMGGLMIQRQGSNAVVSFQPQTTTNLAQPFTNNGTPISHTIPMPGNKGFIRINAKP